MLCRRLPKVTQHDTFGKHLHDSSDGISTRRCRGTVDSSATLLAPFVAWWQSPSERAP